MSARDGGPAFPGAWMERDSVGDLNPQEQYLGMSLRDYFAGQALAGMLASDHFLAALKGKGREIGSDNDHDAATRIAYNFADSMLEERERDS